MHGDNYQDGADERIEFWHDYLMSNKHKHIGARECLPSNYKQTPRGVEKYKRDVVAIGRSVMPDSRVQLGREFLFQIGFCMQGLYTIVDRLEKTHPHSVVKRKLKDLADDSAVDPASPQSVFMRVMRDMVGEKIILPDKPSIDVYWMNTIVNWLVWHRTWVEVSPYTSELLHNCGDPENEDNRAREWAKFLPVVMMADSMTNNIYLCSCVWGRRPEIGMKPSQVDYVESTILWCVNGRNLADGTTQDCGLVTLPDSETYEQAIARLARYNQDTPMVRGGLRWALNAMSLANSNPKYIKPSGKKKNSAMRKEHKGDSPMSVAAEIARPIPVRRSLEQIVTEGGSMLPRSGRGPVSPHYRRGYMRRQRHGEKFEAMHPDVPVFIDRMGNRYHKKQIWPVMVNSELQG